MKDTVTISVDNDYHFKKACGIFGVTYYCISENCDYNRYSIEYNHAQDVLSLGIQIGIESIAKSWQESINQRFNTTDETFTFV